MITSCAPCMFCVPCHRFGLCGRPSVVWEIHRPSRIVGLIMSTEHTYMYPMYANTF